MISVLFHELIIIIKLPINVYFFINKNLKK